MMIYRCIVCIAICVSCVYADLGPQTYTSSPPKTSIEHMDFEEMISFNRNDLQWSGQSKEWREKMTGFANALKENNVKSVYFVHGTFVGNDPFGTVEYLKKMYPDMSKELEEQLRDLVKQSNDIILEDTVNFTKEYVNLFSEATGGDIASHRFLWSSGSHHWARLKAAITLTKSIAKEITDNPQLEGSRFLLVGHSHAGQLFALLTNFLAQSKGVDEVYKVAHEGGIDVSELSNWLDKIRTVQLDIVTYGTPVLYGWGDKGTYRLLNIINHRGKDHLAGNLDNVLYTTDGDYIQQVGITGSGSESMNPWEQKLNEKLYPILGIENSIEEWEKNAQHRMRVPHYGKTLLIDFKDASELFPNCISTMFGHGANTRYEKLLFNTKVIVDHFYSK